MRGSQARSINRGLHTVTILTIRLIFQQDRLRMYNLKMRYFRLNIEAVEKKNITYSKYVFVALIIQYTKRMHAPYCIVVCGLSVCNIIFSRYVAKDMIFEKKIIEHKMCFDFLYTI
jgi:hypothetical protein